MRERRGEGFARRWFLADVPDRWSSRRNHPVLGERNHGTCIAHTANAFQLTIPSVETKLSLIRALAALTASTTDSPSLKTASSTMRRAGKYLQRTSRSRHGVLA